MNCWTGTGHLTRDPELVTTSGGTNICVMRIAVKRAAKEGADGYFDLKAFGKLALDCGEYLSAGREVAIDGRLRFEEFETAAREYASRVYIIAESVEFLASRRGKGSRGDSPQVGEAQPEPVATGDDGGGRDRLSPPTGPRSEWPRARVVAATKPRPQQVDAYTGADQSWPTYVKWRHRRPDHSRGRRSAPLRFARRAPPRRLARPRGPRAPGSHPSGAGKAHRPRSERGPSPRR